MGPGVSAGSLPLRTLCSCLFTSQATWGRTAALSAECGEVYKRPDQERPRKSVQKWNWITKKKKKRPQKITQVSSLLRVLFTCRMCGCSDWIPFRCFSDVVWSSTEYNNFADETLPKRPAVLQCSQTHQLAHVGRMRQAPEALSPTGNRV